MRAVTHKAMIELINLSNTNIDRQIVYTIQYNTSSSAQSYIKIDGRCITKRQ